MEVPRCSLAGLLQRKSMFLVKKKKKVKKKRKNKQTNKAIKKDRKQKKSERTKKKGEKRGKKETKASKETKYNEIKKKRKKISYHFSINEKNQLYKSGPVGPALRKTCGPDSKTSGLGPAGPLYNQGCV